MTDQTPAPGGPRRGHQACVRSGQRSGSRLGAHSAGPRIVLQSLELANEPRLAPQGLTRTQGTLCGGHSAREVSPLSRWLPLWNRRLQRRGHGSGLPLEASGERGKNVAHALCHGTRQPCTHARAPNLGEAPGGTFGTFLGPSAPAVSCPSHVMPRKGSPAPCCPVVPTPGGHHRQRKNTLRQPPRHRDESEPCYAAWHPRNLGGHRPPLLSWAKQSRASDRRPSLSTSDTHGGKGRQMVSLGTVT